MTAIVVEDDDDPIFGQNTIVLTDLLFSEKPSNQKILNANILYLDIGGDYNYHRGFYRAMFSVKNMVRKSKDTIKIGKLTFKNYLGLGVGIGIGDWNKISNLYFEQVEFLKKNKSDKPFNVKVKDLISPKQSLQDKLYEWSKKIFREKLKPQNAT
ncbi:MAG: hypothetical protein KA319_12295 [Ferruginibacter sp.]|nr:hypothetical protein [Ferruginibacter sp.]